MRTTYPLKEALR